MTVRWRYCCVHMLPYPGECSLCYWAALRERLSLSLMRGRSPAQIITFLEDHDLTPPAHRALLPPSLEGVEADCQVSAVHVPSFAHRIKR